MFIPLKKSVFDIKPEKALNGTLPNHCASLCGESCICQILHDAAILRHGRASQDSIASSLVLLQLAQKNIDI